MYPFAQIFKFDPSQPRDKNGQWVKGGSGPSGFSLRSRKGGDGVFHEIVVEGKMVGRVGGFDRGDFFELWNTRIDEGFQGSGLYQAAVQQVADQFKQGLRSKEWQSSLALRKALAKMPTYEKIDEELWVRPTNYRAVEKFDPAQPRDKEGQWVKMWHLTDNPKFKLNPKKVPQDNTTLGMLSEPGLYAAKDLEPWVNGYGYARPFAVELQVPADLSEGGKGYSNERFIPGARLHEVNVSRVIPLDEYVREEYNGLGWLESWRDNVSRPVSMPRGYRYEGPDVRDMTPEQQKAYIALARDYRKANPVMKSFADIFKYDPNQARDLRGRWTDGSMGGMQMVSPNVQEGLGIDQAVQAMGDARTKEVLQASQQVDGIVGLNIRHFPAVGAWKTGAENSLLCKVEPPATYDEIKVSAAMKGMLADQMAVIPFRVEEGGPSSMYSMTVKSSDLKRLNQELVEMGIEYHTLEPAGDSTNVWVFDEKSELRDKIREAAGKYDAQPKVWRGRGEILGSFESRTEGREAYEETIARTLGPDKRGQWEGFYSGWRTTHEVLKAALRGLSHVFKKFNPNQPRDKDGQWTSSGVGAGIDSPGFKAWFGASKVVDANGKPLMLYHGTNADPESFHPNSHFGTAKAANDRYDALRSFSEDVVGRDPGNFQLVPVYLKMENPLRMPDLANIDWETGESIDEAQARFDALDAETQERLLESGEEPRARGWEGDESVALTLVEMGIFDMDEFEENRDNEDAFKLLAAKGYDGIVYSNVVEDAGNDSYIVFDPTQIKSAIGNSGAFDPKDKRITKGFNHLLKFNPYRDDKSGRYTTGPGTSMGHDMKLQAAWLHEKAVAFGYKDADDMAEKNFEAFMSLAKVWRETHVYKGEKKTLYVHRRLLNPEGLIAWAKKNGFTTTLPEDKLHVTVAYSKEPLNWERATKDTQSLRVAGGVRSVAPLGDGGAVVLKFESAVLQKRWRAFRAAGASWDWDSYTPHVTITWDAPDGLDTTKITPYDGPLWLGPEIFEELNEDWKATVVEKYSPNQPRNPAGSDVGGQWAKTGVSAGSKAYTKEQLRAELETFKAAGAKAPNGNWDTLADQIHTASNGRFSPVDVARAMLGQMGPAELKRVEFSAEGATVKVHIFGKTLMGGRIKAHGSDFNELQRTFDFQYNEVLHQRLELPDTAQGKGAVRKMFGAALPLYQKMGMESISLTANIDLGAYAWAKYGFKVHHPEELSAAVYREFENFSAQLGLSPGIRKEMNSVRAMLQREVNNPDLPHLIASLKTPHLDAEMKKNVVWPMDILKRPTFAKALMYDKQWHGRIRFDDVEAMDRMRKYLTEPVKKSWWQRLFKKYNPQQPRGNDGRWIESGAALQAANDLARDKLSSKVRGGDPNQTGYHHSVRISESLEDPVLKIVGMLHDIVEDSDVTVEQLRGLFGKRVADAVDAVTKRKDKGEDQEDYLKRVMSNVDALRVKIADMRDNMIVRPGAVMSEHLIAKQKMYGELFPRLEQALSDYERAVPVQKYNKNHDRLGQFATAADAVQQDLTHNQISKVKEGWVDRNGKLLPDDIAQRLNTLKVYPGWSNISLNPDREARLQVTGYDSKGRKQYLYSKEHKTGASAEKFARLQAFNKIVTTLRKRIAHKLGDGISEPLDDTFAALRIIEKTGLRPGSDTDTKAATKAYGVTTLLGKHVKVTGNKIKVTFPGKKGVENTRTFTDPVLAAYLGRKKIMREGRLFETSDARVRAAMKAIGGEGFTPKDFRTWHGTAKAILALKKLPVPTTKKEAQKVRTEVAKKVSEYLGNTPKVALDAYIAPYVFDRHISGTLVKKVVFDELAAMQAAIDEFIETTHLDHEAYWEALPELGEEIEDDEPQLNAEGFRRVFKYNPDQPRAPAGSGDDSGQWVVDPSGIAESLNEAKQATAEREKVVAGHLDAHPVGYKIKHKRQEWMREDVAGDKFWTDGKKYLSSKQLLSNLGTVLVPTHIPEEIYYGGKYLTKYDPTQPRAPAGSDDGGQWVKGGGGVPTGYSKAARFNGDTVITSNVNDAVRALYEGKKVQLDQPRRIATLLDRLHKIANEAISAGEKAHTYNLCAVSVPGTNLFCAENKGIPRVQMPQLKGKPLEGSPGDKLSKDSRGEVDLSGPFRSYLEKLGFKVTDEEEKAAYLKASQNELNGAKVAGIASRIKQGGLGDERIFISQDNYVVDGHHRWAATVGLDTRDNKLGGKKLAVTRVNAPIIALLALANRFAADHGIPQASVADNKVRKCADGFCETVFKYNPQQPRDPAGSSTGGQWSKGSGQQAFTGDDWNDPPGAAAMRQQLSNQDEIEVLGEMGLRNYTPELADEVYQASGGTFRPIAVMKAFLGEEGFTEENIARTSITTDGSGEDGMGEVTVSMSRVTAHGGSVRLMERSFNFENMDVHHDFLELDEESQGAGVVRKLFEASIPVYQSMGMESISLHANLDMGAYAWARYGFKANYPSEFKQAAEFGLRNLFEESELPPKAKRELDALYDLLDSEGDNEDIPKIFTDAQTPHLDQYIRDNRLGGDLKRPTTAKAALNNQSWVGYMRFDDDESMDRMDTYLKKTRTVKANPYHDKAGRFTFANAASFVSIGGVFDRQRANARARGDANTPVNTTPHTKHAEPIHRTAQEIQAELQELTNIAGLTGFGFGERADRLHSISGGRFSPKEVLTAMLGEEGLTPENLQKVSFRNDHNSIKVAMNGATVHGVPLRMYERTFDFAENDVHHDYLRVPNEDQANGVVRKLFADALPLYKRMGMKSISLSANLQLGAYAWARYGFQAQSPSSVKNYLDYTMGQFITGRDDNNPLSPEAVTEFRGLKALLRDKINSPDLPRLFTEAQTPHLDAMVLGRVGIRKPRFSKAMLYDYSWSAYIRFNNKEAMERMEAYVARPTVRKANPYREPAGSSIGGQFAKKPGADTPDGLINGELPPAPGTAPLKEGHVRLYHQTTLDNLRSIEKTGLTIEHARGIEGPRAVYAGEKPFYGPIEYHHTLEFQVPKDKWDAPFVLRDVTPDDFIGAHYPWHARARYLEKHPEALESTLAGEFDDLEGDYITAVNYIKSKYKDRVKKANPYHDKAGRFTFANTANFVSIGGVFDKQRDNANRRAGIFGPRKPSTAGTPKSKLTQITLERTQLEIEGLAARGLDLRMMDSAEFARRIHAASGGRFSPLDVISAFVGETEPHQVGPNLEKTTIYANPGGKTVQISFGNGAIIHGGEVTVLERNFYFDDNKVYHSLLAVKPQDQAKGVTRKLFEASLDLYEQMGMKKVAVGAGLDGGAYAWARYGFKANDPERLANLVEYRMDQYARQIPNMTPEARRELEALQSVSRQFRNNPDYPWVITDARTPHLDAAMKANYNYSPGLERPTFIKQVMQNGSWSGTMDLTDAEAMARTRAYLTRGKKA